VAVVITRDELLVQADAFDLNKADVQRDYRDRTRSAMTWSPLRIAADDAQCTVTARFVRR